MRFVLTIFSPPPFIELPQEVIGWIGWLALFAIIIFLLWAWRAYNKKWGTPQRLTFLLLLLIVPLTSLYIGVEVPTRVVLPPPGIPVDPKLPVAMIFSALPWFLAGGLLGPLPAAFLAFLSGSIQAVWGTHNPFTPLELALIAVLFSAAVRQRYRTPIFRMIRHPLVASILLALFYPLILLLDTPLMLHGALVIRLDYTLSLISVMAVAMGIVLILAGVFTEAASVALRGSWGSGGPLVASPPEKSLQARFLYSMAPLAILLILILMAADWVIAGNAARSLLRDRMSEAAEMAADGIPYYLEVGQNLITRMASNPALLTATPEQMQTLLQYDLRQVPFFRQLYILDAKGASLAGYPQTQHAGTQAPLDEQNGVQLALSARVPVQYYTIPPEHGELAAQVSFVASILDASGKVRGVMIGRSDLASNPFTQPILNSLKKLSDMEGQGILLDEDGRILYHPDTALLMTDYPGQISQEATFNNETGPDGSRRLVYFQRSSGEPWAVVISVPAHRAQQLALEIAMPLLGMILLMSFVGLFVLRFGLNIVSRSLKTLSSEAGRIAQGQLDHPLALDGEDEIAHLGKSFEQMRTSLKARLEELNRLLLVSQGVASSLEISEAIQPVLEAALASGASSARVVLTPSVVPELDGRSQAPLFYGMGPARDAFRNLDEQVMGITRQQERLVLSSLTRPRILSYQPGAPRPDALLAVPLRHENLYYGALWIAFDHPHNFNDEEVRFITTLAGQAALAAANARLFLNAEIGRQRLAAILASTPDPILVTDQSDCLLLSNPAAAQVLGIRIEKDEGQPIDQLIKQADLVNLIRSSSEKLSVDINLTGGRTFLATASSVLAEGQRVGRVCLLRDVTRLKELNDLKSEFVSTVSHDLRSPLQVMRGYATMLEIVGELNEQQDGYVRKIIIGVETMSRLVNNLLDLGRIEAGIGLQLEIVPVCDVVERVVSGLQPEANQKKIQLVGDFSRDTVPLIEADQALLQQALHNLVENAIKFTRAEGKVNVRINVRQDRMVFEVSDTGIGISPMDQQRLFEKFYRGGQTAPREQRGTGLGLAIVKSIAERHGGRVWVESQLGKGSTFYLAIPLRQPKREQGAA